MDISTGALTYKNSCMWGTTTALPANSYSNGSSGVGATLTGLSLGTFTVDGAGTFIYSGEGTPDNPCATPANVRFYFNTANGPFAYTKYWWSNPVAFPLAAPGSGTFSVTVDPAQWSDWNGQFGTTDVAAFNAAASNPSIIGLSFGGGCFFENGVGVNPGSATFNLNTFTTTGP